jgi:hypothetical protein
MCCINARDRIYWGRWRAREVNRLVSLRGWEDWEEDALSLIER